MSSKTWGPALYPILFLFSLLAGGCLKQAPVPDYYTLSAAEQGAVSGTAYPYPVLVGPVRVASLLERGHLVRQESAHGITLSETHRWAGDLPEMLTDALVSNLGHDLESERVHTFPVSSNLNGFQVELHFLHLEGDDAQQAHIAARWKIISTVNQEILHAETSSHRVKLENNGYDELARGLSLGLSLISHDIADTLVSMQTLPAP
ncbi:MAG: PqiC family protein [Thermodesulfobacteriota bacterium]